MNVNDTCQLRAAEEVTDLIHVWRLQWRWMHCRRQTFHSSRKAIVARLWTDLTHGWLSAHLTINMSNVHRSDCKTFTSQTGRCAWLVRPLAQDKMLYNNQNKIANIVFHNVESL